MRSMAGSIAHAFGDDSPDPAGPMECPHIVHIATGGLGIWKPLIHVLRLSLYVVVHAIVAIADVLGCGVAAQACIPIVV